MYPRKNFENNNRTTIIKQLGFLTRLQRKQLLEDLNRQLEKKGDEKIRFIRDLLVGCIDKRDKE